MIMMYPVRKDGEDELARQEDVEHPLDDAQVGGQRDVALEADVGELGLGRDVDRHVLALQRQRFKSLDEKCQQHFE